MDHRRCPHRTQGRVRLRLIYIFLAIAPAKLETYANDIEAAPSMRALPIARQRASMLLVCCCADDGRRPLFNCKNMSVITKSLRSGSSPASSEVRPKRGSRAMLMLGPKPVKHLRSEGIASPPPHPPNPSCVSTPVLQLVPRRCGKECTWRSPTLTALTTVLCKPVPLGPATALGKLMVTTHPTSIIQLYTYIAYGILWLTYTQTCLSLSLSLCRCPLYLT